MGFIKAFTGALGGTFADQWQDFYMPRQDVPLLLLYSKQYHKDKIMVVERIQRKMKILSVMVVKLLFQKELH